MDRFEQLEIEARLKEALREAKGAYDSAKDEYLQALNRREDLGLSHPDGALTYRLAMKNRALALQTYNLALIRFNRFILDGKLPEEPT